MLNKIFFVLVIVMKIMFSSFVYFCFIVVKIFIVKVFIFSYVVGFIIGKGGVNIVEV